MTRTRTTRYVTLLSVVLALALTAALAACGSDEPSGVTGPDRTASTHNGDAGHPPHRRLPPQGQGTRPLPPIRLYLRLQLRQCRPLPPMRLYLRRRGLRPPAPPKRTGKRWLPSTTQRTVRTGS